MNYPLHKYKERSEILNNILDKIVETIKENKKIAIIAGVVIAVLLLLLIISGGKSSTPGFLETVDEIYNSSYAADGVVTISDKDIQININKSNGTDFSLNASYGDNEYTDLLVKTGNTIYCNSELVEAQSGLLAINTVENEEAKSFYSVIAEALSICENVSFETDDNTQKMVIDSTEGWTEFWQNLYNALSSNSDTIAAGYSTPDVVKAQIKTLTADIKKMAETNTIANTLEISITPAEGSYTVHFDITLDMSMLPSFAKAEDIDSNKLKISGTIIYTVTDGSTIKKPSGAIHAMSAAGTDNLLSSLWNSMFEKGTYVSFNQVSVTNDTVSVTRKLGETTEVCQLVFGADGVTNAAWYITSPNEDLLNAYVTKYKTSSSSSEKENFIITSLDDGTYALTIGVSESGLNSFNKIAKTPKAMGEYLNSAKGGEIIV